MRNSRDGVRGHPPAWVHYMCQSCFAVQPGNVLRSAVGEIQGIYKPEGRFKVPGPKWYLCCICHAFCYDAVWFVQPPHDQPSCQHDPETGAPQEYQPLYANRPAPVPSEVG